MAYWNQSQKTIWKFFMKMSKKDMKKDSAREDDDKDGHMYAPGIGDEKVYFFYDTFLLLSLGGYFTHISILYSW